MLAQLTGAAVSGPPPAGPEFRQREPLRLARAPGATLSGALCAADMGFSLHAATVVRRDDAGGREALARYVLRPPLAEERLSLLPDGRVRLGLKRAYSDGTVAVEMDGLAFVSRLAASIPGPRFVRRAIRGECCRLPQNGGRSSSPKWSTRPASTR